MTARPEGDVHLRGRHPCADLLRQPESPPPLARARQSFEHAERGEALILIPAPALWEVSLLEKHGHVRLSKPYEEWAKDFFRLPWFDRVPLDAEIITESRIYTFNRDIFDSAIVATAQLKDVPLITRDAAITSSGLVEILR